ncbi:carboxypeptidase T [Haloechinothrix alba]|uniref:Zinc carboxypeptidase n=1 Tax=Haloechinothrix alba TaxID=664784 RepID=A0A239ACY9_9PSEU|nr:M14 family metallopeptidase [Haloechinothrix alba]SNR93232.1 carboxypeptidase T [Haloechinothrix alba]
MLTRRLARHRAATLIAGAAGLALLAPLAVTADATEATHGQAQDSSGSETVILVPGADTPAERTEVARTGVDVLHMDQDGLAVRATDRQVAELRARGFMPQRHQPVSIAAPPPVDDAYHAYEEMTAVLSDTAAEHPDITELTSVGTSYEGRDLPLITISDNPAQDSAEPAEPEVLFTCTMHAREHLTSEMCLRIVTRFTSEYGTGPEVTELVNERAIHVLPMVNPDGAAYDVSGERYKGWRKSRMPHYWGSVGTDLNRNWAYNWGCCGGSSGYPRSNTYRGPEPFSDPETRVIAEFVNSRVVDGQQRIAAHVDFHSYGELVLWPFGFTAADTPDGMTEEEYQRFVDVGTAMADTNGYEPMQSSDFYITDGTVNDWMWGEHDILSFTFEMYPSGGGIDGFYPPGSVIEKETARNDAAVDLLLREAG